MKKVSGFTKRMIAILLSSMLIVGMIPVTALAAEVQVNIVQEEEAITTYAVTLDANGGYFVNEWDDVLGEYIESTEILNKKIPVGGTVTSFPVKEQENVVVTFMGWSLERDGDIVGAEYVPVENCTLYAVWQMNEGVTEESVEDAPGVEKVPEEEGDSVEDVNEILSAEETDVQETPVESDDQEAGETDAQKNAEEAVRVAAEDQELETENAEVGESTVATEEKDTKSEKQDAAMDVVASGMCGDNVNWTLDSQGVLTASGTGEMWAFDGSHDLPWKDHLNDINKVVINEGITSIGNSAFEYANSLCHLELPNSLLAIGLFAFRKCSSLQEINLPYGINSVGQQAFEGTAITTLTFPETINFLDGTSCYYCDNLKTIYIKKCNQPSFIIGIPAFSCCKSLEGIYVEEGHFALHDEDGVLFLGNTVVRYPCAKKGDSFTIAEGVTIAGEPFRQTEYLKHVDLSNLTTIPERALFGCRSLTSVTLPDSLTSIPDDMFWDCGNLLSITIPESVTSIGAYAFGYCSSLTSITIPDGVTSIGHGAFSNCSSLTSITIPDGVTSVGDYAFIDCSGLTSITIPDSVTSVGRSAFYSCSGLTSITISDGVTSIGDYEFYSCSSLTSITIPDGVTSIGDYAFDECSSLTSITIPDGVTSIGDYAFDECSSLTSITIPDSVTSIGRSAFMGCCGITSITIPDSVTSIGGYVFGGCYNLTSLYFTGNAPSIAYDAFIGFNTIANAVAYYPANNSTWTEDIRQNYGGTISWQPLCLEHTWDEIYTVDTPATCTEEGFESIHCSVCDEIQKGSARTIAKLDHTYDEWETVKEPTYEETGLKERVCTACGDIEQKIIEKKQRVSIDDATVMCIIDKTYNGSAQTQNPTVMIGDKTLTKDRDYTLSYSKNVNAGTATMNITGIGNYTGTKTATFTIKPVGWYKDGGEWYYYNSDGTKLTNGWAQDSAGWYWLDEDGKITKSKWVKSGGYWYYLGANGIMTTGWQQVGGKWYYMNSSGVMTTGWQQVGGKWYYMNPSGVMTTGWQQVGGKWYYMNSSGVMTTGWQQIGGKWYYMNSSGVMMTGWQKIGGKKYYFNSSGVWVK